MSTRQTLLVVAAGAFLSPLAYASPARVAVQVRIYNSAAVPVEMRHQALTLATRLLAAGQIGVHWVDCGIGHACGAPPSTGELVVRLVRSARPGPAAAPLVLGEASIDSTARAGVLASVYVDRVERMAGMAETNAASLLGRAIAHEIGHLLLASNAHSAHGLMRARWSSRDLRRDDELDWVLTEADAAAIRRRLQELPTPNAQPPSLPHGIDLGVGNRELGVSYF